MLVRDKLITLGWKNAKPTEIYNIDVLNQNLIIPRFHSLLLNAEIIEASQAVGKFYSETRREVWEYEKHFDCILPPFNLFFLETEKPIFTKSDVAFDDSSRLPNSWGVLFQKISLDAGFSQSELTKIYNFLKFPFLNTSFVYAMNFVYDEYNQKDAFGFPEITKFFLVNEVGKVIKNPQLMLHKKYKYSPQEQVNAIQEVFTSFSLSAFYSLDLLNSLQWKLEKKFTSSGILGKIDNQSKHYNLLTHC
jgi:hypothetical protein